MRPNYDSNTKSPESRGYRCCFLRVRTPSKSHRTYPIQNVVSDFFIVTSKITFGEYVSDLYSRSCYVGVRYTGAYVNYSTCIKRSWILFVQGFSFLVLI